MKKFFLFLVLIFCAVDGKEFKDLDLQKPVYLYAGDIIFYNQSYKKFIGLSLTQNNQFHIKHDVTHPFSLPDCCVDIFQSEDVFEHIEYAKLFQVINEIFRVLKVGGIFRLSMPDYRCDVLIKRSLKDDFGNILFDSGGGGKYVNGKVIGGGHLWFPKFETVSYLLNNTRFASKGRIVFHHYYESEDRFVLNPIDYKIGFVKRTPDHDSRIQNPRRPMSIVVDCIKEQE